MLHHYTNAVAFLTAALLLAGAILAAALRTG